MYIDKLDDILNKYNNTYHIIFKIKSVDVKSSKYIDYKEYPRYAAIDYVRISKYQRIFTNGHIPDWSEDFFVIKRDFFVHVITFIRLNVNNLQSPDNFN